MQVLFEKYKLINKIICYVKYEGTNLSTMINGLKQIIYYEELRIPTPYEGVCFGRAHFIVCQYATSDEKIRLSS